MQIIGKNNLKSKFTFMHIYHLFACTSVWLHMHHRGCVWIVVEMHISVVAHASPGVCVDCCWNAHQCGCTCITGGVCGMYLKISTSVVAHASPGVFMDSQHTVTYM
jgi:hypothetical protein